MDIKKIEHEIQEHGLELSRFSEGISAEALPELESTEDSIYGLAAKLFNQPYKIGVKSVNMLNDIRERISDIRSNVYENLNKDIDNKSEEITKRENDYWAGILAVPALSDSWMKKIRQYGIYNGLTIKEIIRKIQDQDSSRIFEAISRPYVAGDPLSVAIENIKNESVKSKRYIITQIDSIVFGIAGDSAMAFSRVHHLKILYSAVMDMRVCSKCSELDGEIFEYDAENIPHVPQHANCRCMLIPIKD